MVFIFFILLISFYSSFWIVYDKPATIHAEIWLIDISHMLTYWDAYCCTSVDGWNYAVVWHKLSGVMGWRVHYALCLIIDVLYTDE